MTEYPEANVCGVVLGMKRNAVQEVISCEKQRPCPDHPLPDESTDYE